MLLLHLKNKCLPSSSYSLEIAQILGQSAPFTSKCTRLDNKLRHIRHMKFLIFGGSFSFHMAFQCPSTRCCSITSLLSRMSLYALLSYTYPLPYTYQTGMRNCISYPSPKGSGIIDPSPQWIVFLNKK